MSAPDAVREAVGREEIGTAEIVPTANLSAWLAAIVRGDWTWTTNSPCKYVTLHIDTRRGAYRVEDRDGNAISFHALLRQSTGSLDLSALQLADTRMEATPAAKWREKGEPDPHGTDYDCERAKLCGGHLTDDEVAFETAMLMRTDLNHEAVLQTAKDRIRWLSRALVAATTHPRMEAAGLREACERSQARLRAFFVGQGTVGGSCGLCASTWGGDSEQHRDGCLIVAIDAALAKSPPAAPSTPDPRMERGMVERAASIADKQAAWEREQAASAKTQREKLCHENAAHACEMVAAAIRNLPQASVQTDPMVEQGLSNE